MRQEYIKELEELKLKMEEAEIFAKKLPMFSDLILERKLTGNENWVNFGNRYKDLYFHFDINRGFYLKESRRNVTNYTGKSYSVFLFNIYINTYSMFNHHSIRVDDVAEEVDVFFYDKLNSTFYATDDQIGDLLESLNSWYKRAVQENNRLLAEKNKKEAVEKLKKAQDYLKSLEVRR